MRQDILVAAAALARLTAAQSTTSEPEVEDDAAKVAPGCYPADDASAPCVQIGIIESICMQRGISLDDHQRCMCEGSYFADWRGCQECLRVHGVYGEGDVRYWESIMEGASSSFCDSSATPTTYLAAVFADEAISAEPRTEASSAYERTTIVEGTEVAVSEYYTVPEEQGPGITPTVTAPPETETETETTSTSDTETETETETGSGSSQGNDNDDDGDDDGAGGRVYAHGAAVIAMVVAGGALMVVM